MDDPHRNDPRNARGDSTDDWYTNPPARSWRRPSDHDGSTGARAFHAGLPGYAPTPLHDLPALAAELGVGRVLVKDESDRLGLPAFKILGASWACARVLGERGATGTDLASLRAAGPLDLVTATEGNHGRAVARMAGLLSCHATVFVPEGMTATAAAAIEGEGARVVRVDGGYEHAVGRAADHARQDPDGRALVQDTAWPGYERVPSWIVEGYGTLFAEIDEALDAREWPAADLVTVPVGVGSLAQAALAHYRDPAWSVAPAVLSVEPVAAPCALASLRAGRSTTVATAGTTMAGLHCAEVSELAWPLLRDGCDAAVAVSDDQASRAENDLAELGAGAGPCGAASLAGVRAALSRPGRREALGLDGGSTVVLLSTEGARS
ncbi:diaminopropionate ammonia-lyase [Nocardiopsis sp. HNM0947]|uniref:Diaminopropionate ammonia-lyase n=1 Tax=Nocardiopsis coralli TaxID=2772213 RepID=A0ABR9P8Y5_9ACTN|nr:diaminopropionate ammonia-lyase [Nocardiopsis coralli]MBE3000307.1 diaminopropionate ammonia-lyase [Nocardiopsis coralli]